MGCGVGYRCSFLVLAGSTCLSVVASARSFFGVGRVQEECTPEGDTEGTEENGFYWEETGLWMGVR